MCCTRPKKRSSSLNCARWQPRPTSDGSKDLATDGNYAHSRAASRSVLPLRSRDPHARDGNGSHSLDSSDGNSQGCRWAMRSGIARPPLASPAPKVGAPIAKAGTTGAPIWPNWRGDQLRRPFVPRQRTVAGLGLAGIYRAPLSTRLPSTADLVAGLDRLERGKSWGLSSGTPLEITLAWIAETSRLASTDSLVRTRGLGFCAASARRRASRRHLVAIVIFYRTPPIRPKRRKTRSARQWLGTELPLALAYGLPELKPARQLARCGGQELATVLCHDYRRRWHALG